jgi:hypothetical protein
MEPNMIEDERIEDEHEDATEEEEQERYATPAAQRKRFLTPSQRPVRNFVKSI